MNQLDTALLNLADRNRAQRLADYRTRRASTYRALGLPRNATAGQIHAAITSQS